MPNKLSGAVETLQKNIDDVVKAGGIAQINHPNYIWALTAEQLIQLRNYTLLEIHNGHPLVNNLGGGGSPSAESIWDSVLTSGKLVFGIADDDSHYFKRIGDPTLPDTRERLDLCSSSGTNYQGHPRFNQKRRFLCVDRCGAIRLSGIRRTDKDDDQRRAP